MSISKHKPNVNPLVSTAAMAVVALGLLGNTGCHHHLVSSACHAVPANRLDPNLFACRREAMGPLPYSALGQQRPQDHIVGAGDTLSVFVYGVYPPTENETPVQQRNQPINQRYYPPHGSVVSPSTGLPLQVDSDGTITLPLIGTLNVAGLTPQQIIELIRTASREQEVLNPGQEQITVDLLIPRVRRVVVLREDTPNSAVALTSPQAVDQIHRGSGEVIDLPIYENDVLHALASTGGLPGTDAARELYVIRAGAGLNTAFMSGSKLQSIVTGDEGGLCNPGVIRIPLAGCACEAIPFAPEDVILNDGDTVFIPRRNEYFIAAGMLPGGRVPLPRDEDVDVIEAIAMANGSAGGPLGTDGSALMQGRAGNLREPTRVLILRTLEDGRQIPIRVDLDRAVEDARERIIIQPNDVVALHFKPASSMLNGTLNWISGASVVAAFSRQNN
ncbi:MAG: polysaccharide biosynthesis/export family protein [Planctomycetota bacterium]